MLFQRLGTLKPQKQGYWKSAPAGEGLWAFPWPHFSLFFADHQYRSICPRRFKEQHVAGDDPWEGYEHWQRKLAPRVLPIRRFWYSGDLFTHLGGRGDDLGLREWQRVSSDEFGTRANRYWARASRFAGTRIPRTPNTFDAEVLEVFLPTRGGHFEPAAAPRFSGGCSASPRGVGS